MTTAEKLEALDIGKITKAYNGKAGRCCCGCSGTYKETEAAKKRVLNLLRANAALVRDLGTCFVLETGTRVNIAYLD